MMVKARAAIMSTKTGTATPIPAFAPVEREVELGDEGVGVGDALAVTVLVIMEGVWGVDGEGDGGAVVVVWAVGGSGCC